MVFVLGKPVIRTPSDLIAAVFEEDKVLTCDIQEGNPPPKVLWEFQVDTCEESAKDCKPLDGEWKPAPNVSYYYLVSTPYQVAN